MVPPNNFVFIALPSISFVMTAAKSPYYSALSSLLSITFLFAFCPHRFNTCPATLAKYKDPQQLWYQHLFSCSLKIRLTALSFSVIAVLEPHPQYYFCFSCCTCPLAAFHHQIWPRSLKPVFSCTSRTPRLTTLPLFIHPHIVSIQVIFPAFVSGYCRAQPIHSHQTTAKSTQHTL